MIQFGITMQGGEVRHMLSGRLGLFEPGHGRPLGFQYQAEVLPACDERVLSEQLAALPLRAFEFRGYLGKRRVISFGWQYDFNKGALRKAGDIPSFLLPLCESAARFSGMAPSDLGQVLVTEYPAGAEIGWHRDKPMFDRVVGILRLSPCRFRFRRRSGTAWSGTAWERASLTAEPRSAYLLQGPSRTEWEHSILLLDHGGGTFGGAYAVLAYVAQQAVEHCGWLQPAEMLDGLLTTWVTFVPCVLWIFLGAPFVEALRGNKALGGRLSAITAAGVGVVLNLAVWFALHVLFRDVVKVRAFGMAVDVPVWSTVNVASLILTVAAMLAVFRFKVGMIPVLAACSAAGIFLYLAFGFAG